MTKQDLNPVKQQGHAGWIISIELWNFLKTFWFVYVKLGSARTDRFASSKTNGDMWSCKEMEECQFKSLIFKFIFDGAYQTPFSIIAGRET